MLFKMFVVTWAIVLLCNYFDSRAKRLAKDRELADKQQVRAPQAQTKAETVDMTPPVLAQPTISNDPQSKPVQVVEEAETTVVKVSENSFVTAVMLDGSKVTRKGTALDPARWACPKSVFGEGHASAPQAVRSLDSQRHATALRLREEAMAQAAAERKAEVKRAKKFKARMKAFRQSIVDAADKAAEDELLEHHLREAGVI